MLTSGNQKLGHIGSFSIPYRTTCPGRTTACLAHCYAKRGFYTMPSTKTALRRNHRLSKRKQFADAIISEIQEKQVRRLRIHASGDFYSTPYIRKWIAIAKACRTTVFLFYTRSWRVGRMRRALLELASLPNVRAWWSVDEDTVQADERPPLHLTARVAYMRRRPDDTPPDYVDLVFRTYRNSVEKYIDQTLVCPAENGVKTQVKITCDICQICLRRRDVPRKLLDRREQAAA
jgi:hypothetical protein